MKPKNHFNLRVRNGVVAACRQTAANINGTSCGGALPRRRYDKFFLLLICLAFALLPHTAWTQDDAPLRSLPRFYFRNGEATLRAFAPVSAATRHSIVELDVDGDTVALGTVMDTNGLVLTKASELKPGKLTCWLALDEPADVVILNVDEDEDVALLRVKAPGLKPIQWAKDRVAVGQWAITPSTAEMPQAVGIVSATSRRIRPQQAFIGIQFDVEAAVPKIGWVFPGLGGEKAGLKSGDIILFLNNTAVTNRDEVKDMLGDFRAGQTIKLRIQRGGKQIEAGVTLSGADSRMPPGSDVSAWRHVRLNGAVSERAEGFDEAIEHDTILDPRFCGGPLVNLDGQAIGLNIARADRDATYALPAALVKRIFANLKSTAAEPVQTSKDTKAVH